MLIVATCHIATGNARYLITGCELNADTHAVIEFGSYVQTHEEHTNNMNDRTLAGICLGPTGNDQGGHWFLSLTSGSRVMGYKWTELPMPNMVIDRVTQMGQNQNMPPTITYANRMGDEVRDRIEDFNDDDKIQNCSCCK